MTRFFTIKDTLIACSNNLANKAFYIPTIGIIKIGSVKSVIANEIRQIFNAPNKAEADRLGKLLVKKYEKTESKFSNWLELNLHQSLSVFGLDLSEFNRKRLRTTNMLERLNQTIKNRTRVAKIFPNIESCSRLVGALLMEQSEAWLDSKSYIS